MRVLTAFLLVSVLLTTVALADDSDDTLKYYLSKSDLVVKGKIKTEPIGRNDEVGVPTYMCEFAVAEVSKGTAKLKEKTIKIGIMRFEMHKKDHHPLIRKNTECILFLKKQPKGYSPQWATADFWFGVQHPSPSMLRSLKRLAEEKTVEQTETPDKK